MKWVETKKGERLLSFFLLNAPWTGLPSAPLRFAQDKLLAQMKWVETKKGERLLSFFLLNAPWTGLEPVTL